MLPILLIWLTVALTTRDPSAFVPVLIVLLVLIRLTGGGERRWRYRRSQAQGDASRLSPGGS